MSITNFTDVQGFSISGLQNITADTINGNTILSSITIAGQTAFLSFDSTTSTLTLLIPTATGILTGLINLSSNNIFTGNITFDGNTQTLNNNTIIGGPLFFTGATIQTTPDILYIDNFTGLVTKGPLPASASILPLDNIFTGNLNQFINEVAVDRLTILNNNSISSQVLNVFRGLGSPDFLFFSDGGRLGVHVLGNPAIWALDMNGDFTTFGKISAVGNIETTTGTFLGRFLTLNPNLVGNVMRVNRSDNSNDFLFFNNTPSGNVETTFGFSNGTANSWAIETSSAGNPLFSILRIGFITASNSIGSQGGIVAVGGFFGSNINLTNTSIANKMKHTVFEYSPAVNSWITTTHGTDDLVNTIDGDKVVIGNIHPVDPAFGATIGAHNFDLSAWRTLFVNLGGTTIMPTLIVTVSFTAPSDRRLKDEIRYLDSGKSIDFIKRLKPCIYKRIDKRNLPNFTEPEAKLQHGFIADEIEEIAVTEAQKNLVDTFEFNGYKDCRKLAILNLIPEIVQANKEMIDKIERLETENKLLNERLLKIENLIAKKKCFAFI